MNKWDERYNTSEYVYGKEPNQFLVLVTDKIPKGKVLCLAEGEGRNAVYLAKMGYDVTAVDFSNIGIEKVQKLAKENSLTVKTIVTDLAEYNIEKDHWNGIISIFCHLPQIIRTRIHNACVDGLKQEGVFIMEAYSARQLLFKTGGPKVPELLYDLQNISKELNGLQFQIKQEIEREICEGSLHKGLGSVIQILAQKKEHSK